jgi:hypothetical protein
MLFSIDFYFAFTVYFSNSYGFSVLCSQFSSFIFSPRILFTSITIFSILPNFLRWFPCYILLHPIFCCKRYSFPSPLVLVSVIFFCWEVFLLLGALCISLHRPIFNPIEVLLPKVSRRRIKTIDFSKQKTNGAMRQSMWTVRSAAEHRHRSSKVASACNSSLED